MAGLAPEDRSLAEAQQYCAVISGNHLGAMGAPVKVLVKGQVVFLCCEGCREKALANPDRTLARVQQLRAKATGHPGH